MIYIIFLILMIVLLGWAYIRSIIIKTKGVLVDAEVVEIKEITYKSQKGEVTHIINVYTVQFQYNDEVVNAKLTAKARFDIGSILQGRYIHKKNKKVVHLRENIETVTFSNVSIFMLILLYACVAIVMVKLDIAAQHPIFIYGGILVVIMYGVLISCFNKKNINKKWTKGGDIGKVDTKLTKYKNKDDK